MSRLGLDALLHRHRPGPLQRCLDYPCMFLARKFYSLRPSPPQKPIEKPVSVVCVCDTHNSQPSLPNGDILIHAGNLTQGGTLQELQGAISWLCAEPHPIKIVIAGNHDVLLDPDYGGHRGYDREQAALERRMIDWGNIIYLDDSKQQSLAPMVDNFAYTAALGRPATATGLFNTPVTTIYGPGRFQRASISSSRMDRQDPIWTWGDLAAIISCESCGGCVLRLHVFGHIHEGSGVELVHFDELQRACEVTVMSGGGI